ncbi:DUF5011 domain-containing protein, partial [Bifidobacterium longum]|nr:DUF5011 domain-containing protein [Bifidobacterium longum]
MGKKKLTKKRKKQLLAMFMTAGIITNTMVSTGIAFADINTTISNISNKVIQQDGAIPFVNLGPDDHGENITSVAIVDDTLKLTRTLNLIDGEYRVTYDIVGSNSPEFNYQEATNIETILAYSNQTFTGVTKVSNYPNFKYYYLVDYLDPSATPIIRINGTDLGKEVDLSDLTANNASVDYGSTWNDDVAKQVTGVKATDKDGNDVTNDVTVSGNVDTKKPGNYNVTFTSPESGKSTTVVITVKSAKYEKPVLENPYIYQTALKGKTTPDTDVVISDSDSFEGFATVHSDSSGNFTASSSLFNSLAKHTPGTTLYVKAGNIDQANYSEVATTLIHYPTPKVTESYAYDTEIKGTAYPNSQVYISDENDFDGYAIVEVDSSGNFTAPVSLLKPLGGYEIGNTLYFRSAEVADSQAMSLTASTKITENEASITANDFTLEYGADFNDQIAIDKAGATATDANGNVEGVKIKANNVDTSKPGEYSITFVSDSGKEKTVKVTVKEQEVTKPNAPVITSNPYYYGDNLIGEIAPGLTVKVYPNGGNLDNALEFETTSGTFAFTADEMKKAFGDQYKANRLLAVVAYDQTTGMTSDATPVMVLPSQAPTLEAESTIHVAYGSDWNDDIAKKQAKVKATDAKGNDVT